MSRALSVVRLIIPCPGGTTVTETKRLEHSARAAVQSDGRLVQRDLKNEQISLCHRSC